MTLLNICIRNLKQSLNFLFKIIFLLRIVRLNTVWLTVRHWYRKKIKHKISPAAAVIALTYKCQFKCKHCAVVDYDKSYDNELSISEIKNIIDQLYLLRIPRVYFDGGEPLLKEELNELLEYCSRKGLIVSLETNGFLLSEEKIVNLKRSGVSCINLSLYDDEEYPHDKFTGVKGSFKQVINAIELCNKHRILCLVSIVVTKNLIKEGRLKEMIYLSKRKKANAVRLTAPHFIGRWHNIYHPLNEEEKRYIDNLSFSFPPIFKRVNVSKCIIGYTLYISPSGEVQLCEFIPYSFGNVREKPLEGILKLMCDHKMFEKTTSCRIDDPIFRSKYINDIKRESIPIKLY